VIALDAWINFLLINDLFLKGYIADRSWANRLFLYNTSLVLCGLSTAMSFLCTDFISLGVYATLYGLFLSEHFSEKYQIFGMLQKWVFLFETKRYFV